MAAAAPAAAAGAAAAQKKDRGEYPAGLEPPKNTDTAATWRTWWSKARDQVTVHLTDAQKADIPAATSRNGPPRQALIDAIEDEDSAVRRGFQLLVVANKAAAAVVVCTKTRSEIAARPDFSATWKCPDCKKDILGHNSGSAAPAIVPAASAAGASAGADALVQAASALSAVAAALPTSTATADKAKSDEDKLTAKSFHDMDAELFKHHPRNFDAARVAAIIGGIKEERPEIAQARAVTRDELKSAVKGAKLPGTLTDPEIENLTLTAVLKDCTISSHTASSSLRRIADNILLSREMYRRDRDTPVGDPSRVTLERPSGATGVTTVAASSVVDEHLVHDLDELGREDILSDFRKMSDEARSDVVRYVKKDPSKGKNYAMCPVLRIAKLRFGGQRNWLANRRPGWRPGRVIDYMIGSAHRPAPITDTRSDMTCLLATTVTRGALVALAASDPTGEILGESLNAHREELRRYVVAWKEKYVFSTDNKADYKALVDAGGAGTGAASGGPTVVPSQPGNKRTRNGAPTRTRGGNPTPSGAGAAGAAAGSGGTGTGGGGGGGGGGGRPGQQRPGGGGGGAPSTPSGPLFTKCMWAGGCPSVVPKHILAQYGGTYHPLCARHRADFKAMTDADKKTTHDAIVKEHPNVAGLSKALNG